MSRYYYLMAQLPAILPNNPLALSYASFLELAGRFLSKKDIRLLNRLSLEPERNPETVPSSLVQLWYDRERSLRLSLARLRMTKLGRDASLRGSDEQVLLAGPDMQGVARAAFAMDNPLDAEQFLDTTRFSWIEELSRGHYFDSEAVFAYALKVLIRERGNRFNDSAGRESYTSIYTQILGEEA